MGIKPYHQMTDEELDAVIDAAMEQAKNTPEGPRILDATYHPGSGLDLFVIRVSDGRRLILPRESLQFVSAATPEQAADFTIEPHGRHIWWPQLDEGFRLEGLLEGRFGNAKWMAKLAHPLAAFNGDSCLSETHRFSPMRGKTVHG